MAKWRPIKTAPKDASRIILGWCDGDVAEGFWHDGSANYWGFPGFYFSDDELLTSRPCKPTHWMPLPNPPGK